MAARHKIIETGRTLAALAPLDAQGSALPRVAFADIAAMPGWMLLEDRELARLALSCGAVLYAGGLARSIDGDVLGHLAAELGGAVTDVILGLSSGNTPPPGGIHALRMAGGAVLLAAAPAPLAKLAQARLGEVAPITADQTRAVEIVARVQALLAGKVAERGMEPA